MAGILGIDLDLHELHLAELQPAAGGQSLHAALVLPIETADPVALGAQLKDRLKSVGFKATSAVIALGHDAMTCREVRHPDIPAGELPAIVQFQVMKESALPPDDAIVDYIPLDHKLATGERRSLTYLVRKARVLFCEKLCEAAGLKLLYVVPQAVALFACVNKGKADPSQPAIGYSCSNSFFVVHNGDLILNRSMGQRHEDEHDVMEALEEKLAELRRSIAGYENQPSMPPLSQVFQASHEIPPEAMKQLNAIRVPVRLYDPYAGIAGADRLLGHGDYAVACGAAQCARAFKKPPVEFLSPKKVVVKPNNTRRYAIMGGAAAALIALVIGGAYWMFTSSADADIAEIQDRIKDMQKREKTFVEGDVEKRYDAIKNWKDHEIFVLEELYDLMDTFPDIAGVQIIKAEWKTVTPATNAPGGTALPAAKTPVTAASKSTAQKPIGRLVLKATAEEEGQLDALKTALRNSKHWKWVKSDLVPQEKNTMVYELDVMPLKPEDYKAVIALGNNITSTDGSSTNRPGTRRGFRPTTGGRP